VTRPHTYDPRRGGERVRALFKGAERIIIVSPFVTRAGVDPLLEVLSPGAVVTLYTRWRADEVAAGVSDTGVLTRLGPSGRVLLSPLLHAKVYLRPGRAALVGSANLTATGLGWRDEGAGLELLVEVPEADQALAALFNDLEAHAYLATPSLAALVDEQAKALAGAFQRPPSIPPRALTKPWIPSYNVPRVLWAAYKGDWDPDVILLARSDLDALQVPPRLTERQFNAYVGNILIQGFPGRVAERLRGLSTFQAVTALSQAAHEAGIPVDNPETAWGTLVAWFRHFLPTQYEVASGGRTLIG